jgi:hypothetical protein
MAISLCPYSVDLTFEMVQKLFGIKSTEENRRPSWVEHFGLKQGEIIRS